MPVLSLQQKNSISLQSVHYIIIDYDGRIQQTTQTFGIEFHWKQ